MRVCVDLFSLMDPLLPRSLSLSISLSPLCPPLSLLHTSEAVSCSGSRKRCGSRCVPMSGGGGSRIIQSDPSEESISSLHTHTRTKGFFTFPTGILIYSPQVRSSRTSFHHSMDIHTSNEGAETAPPSQSQPRRTVCVCHGGLGALTIPNVIILCLFLNYEGRK